MTYCKDYCEEKGISTSKLNEAQKTLYYIAENMKMEKSISEEGYRYFQMAIQSLENQKSITEELEKIKAEIKDLHNSHMIHLIDTDGAVDTCLDIIDRNISKLKGE